MGENLFVEERRQYILDQLNRTGRVSVKDLSDQLGVSAVTIRQDLRSLEETGYLERTYGGALPRTESNRTVELSFHVRQRRHQSEKDAIGYAAYQMVKDGWSVALDGSSTAYSIAKHLRSFSKLTVVTNSLMIAQVFLDSPQIHVLIPGGHLRRDSISIVGKPEDIAPINLNIGFFGTRGITWGKGVTDVGADEVAIKQALIARCVATVIVADGSKWGEVAPYTFVTPQEVSRFITDTSAPASVVEQFRSHGCDVLVVSPSAQNEK
jgi:DeoR family fructose operon transcriptional repressor